MSSETSQTSYFERLPHSTDPRRFAPIAIGLGFLLVCLVIAGLSAVARDDGGSIDFLISEGAKRRPAAAEPAYARPMAYAPVQPRSSFWSVFERPKPKREANEAPRVRRAAAPPRRVEAASPLSAPASVETLGKRSVCVRLCDGYFFPIGPIGDATDTTSHEALCSGLCPGAPTRLYVQPAGSDNIDDATSVKDHKRYSALPVAYRHSDTADNTCSCRRPGQSHARLVSAYKDFTLRKGDSIMTAQGFRVFRGSHSYPYKPRDFVALSKDHELSRSQQGRLRKLERAAFYNKAREDAAQPAETAFEAASSPRLDRPGRRNHVQVMSPDRTIVR